MSEQEALYDVVWPLGKPHWDRRDLNPAIGDLNGKTIAEVWDRVFRGEGSEEMTVWALHDASGRVMILVIHNSDVSDGWEREGENEFYFNRYSEKVAYPLAINIIFYFIADVLVAAMHFHDGIDHFFL